MTVIEREARVLARVASPWISEFVRRRHEAQGVHFRLERGLERIEGERGATREVMLDDGQVLPVDLLLLGIGGVPNQELAFEAGLRCDDGIVVDGAGWTDDPAIFALGDVARQVIVPGTRGVRLECVSGALDQAKRTSAAIALAPLPQRDVATFWSDQYDMKLQAAGVLDGAGAIVFRQAPGGGKAMAFHLCEGRIAGVEAVNAGADFMAAKAMIAAGKAVDVVKLGDPDVPLGEVEVGQSG